MVSNPNFRISQWQAPPRPEWVQRVNREGSYLDLESVVPLDENSLIEHAQANTGLSDFGIDDWYEPFQVFIKALDEEADLTLMGRLMTRSDILMHLEARLHLEDTFKKHPQIEEQELLPPIMIVGSGRSGTSAIQNLMAHDPDNNTPLIWEALLPTPPPTAETYYTDPRIEIADRRISQWGRVTPEIDAMHEFRGHMPAELIHIETISFQSTGHLDLYGFVPSYDAYMSRRGAVPAMSYAKRVLKLLQWKNKRKRWNLKSPDAMRFLPDLFQVFPDVQLVWMHRDPIMAVSSVVSLIGTLFAIRSDRPLSEASMGQLTNPGNLADLLNNAIDLIETGRIPQERITHVQYLDFVEDPLGTVERLYREMGMPLTEQGKAGMQEYMRKHPREARPKHKYNVGDRDRHVVERKLFERYQTRFDVRTEV
ncbi:MAG: sulfotransferase [Steroidobacteraceae bacterium]